MSNENTKALESEIERQTQTIRSYSDKNGGLKDKRNQLKRDNKQLREERASLQGQNHQLQSQVEDQQCRSEKLAQDLDIRSKQCEAYEVKLRENQQVLVSNKNLIEFLNKSLNEAQKYSFRTMIGQKTTGGQFLPEQTTFDMGFQHNLKNHAISPLRSTQAGVPRIDTTKLQDSN